ncbi:MAG: hypothetical protein N0E38_04540 [Candidatus Thiodiazotropha endolucinida]|nr:hypothetical protein [Candidatus Thiodiazotropha taylori]MCW4348214.1 hypothetical protein [Candidatus Thiodiazotropha endolucinida]
MIATLAPLPDVLSLWEIANRWHSINPLSEGPLPIPVQDTLRQLTRAIYQHKLTLANERGREYGNLMTTVDYDEFVLESEENEDNEEAGDFDLETKRYEAFLVHQQQRIRQHDELVADFPACFHGQDYDRSLLTGRFVIRHALTEYCEKEGISFPAFWSTEQEPSANKSKRPTRTSQIDKLLVQAVARTLWDIDPDYTIAKLIDHKAIQVYANGSLYTGRHTLRNWISEVDPRADGEKRGRPKNK